MSQPHSNPRDVILNAIKYAPPRVAADGCEAFLRLEEQLEACELAREEEAQFGARMQAERDEWRGRAEVTRDHARGDLLTWNTELQEQFEALRETITRQHSLLWMVGLDTHDGEELASEEIAVRNLRELLSERSNPASEPKEDA